MKFFKSKNNPLHQKYQQLRRQKKALELEPDSIDYNAQKGKINGYKVTLENCTCVDFEKHHKPCKHMYCLAIKLGAFEVNEEVLEHIDLSSNEKISNEIERYPVSYFYEMAVTAPKDFVVIDFETANGNADSICQMGIAVVENNSVTEQKNFMIRPPYEVFTNSYIHGITFDDVKDAPNFAEIWEQVEKYIKNQKVAAYNLPFDLGCLYASLDRYKIKKPDFMSFDILENVRNNIGLCSCKLVDVAKYLKIEHKAHDALSDSKVAAEIQIYLNKRFSNEIYEDFYDDISEVPTILYFMNQQSLYNAIALSKISFGEIMNFTKEFIKFEEDLNYEDYKELLNLLEQTAAKNDSGKLYKNCGLMYEKFGKISDALEIYKKALAIDESLRLKTRITRIEKALLKNKLQ